MKKDSVPSTIDQINELENEDQEESKSESIDEIQHNLRPAVQSKFLFYLV